MNSRNQREQQPDAMQLLVLASVQDVLSERQKHVLLDLMQLCQDLKPSYLLLRMNRQQGMG